jgi:hypothetical protein
MTVAKKKMPAPKRAGNRDTSQQIALRIARALNWDLKAIDAMATLLEQIGKSQRPLVRKTNQTS